MLKCLGRGEGMKKLCIFLATLIIISMLAGCGSSVEDKARIAELEAELELQKQTTTTTTIPTTTEPSTSTTVTTIPVTTTTSSPTPDLKKIEIEGISLTYDSKLFRHSLFESGTHYLYVRDGQSMVMIQFLDLDDDVSGIEKAASIVTFDAVAESFEDSFKFVLFDPDSLQPLFIDGRISYSALIHLYDGSFPYSGNYSCFVTALYGRTSMHMLSFMIANGEWDDYVDAYFEMISEIKVIR